MHFLIAIFVLFLMLMFSIFKVLKEYELAVIFRLGRVLDKPKGPGLIILIPLVDKMIKVDTRVVTMDVPPQDIITKDNVSVKVNAVVYFQVMAAKNAIIQVENYLYATSQLSQTTLRSILGQAELDELLSEREKINEQLQSIIDKHTDPWGIKVNMVEIKHVDLPQEMQRAMAKQAEAERERRSKIIRAEGEFQAAAKMSDAAAVFEKHPMALQMRYLQTLVEVAAENNSTTLFLIPIDLFKPFQDISSSLQSIADATQKPPDKPEEN